MVQLNGGQAGGEILVYIVVYWHPLTHPTNLRKPVFATLVF
jgi:hypothetical protein